MVGFLSATGNAVLTLFSILILLVQTWLLGAAVRRVLGVRTGLVRTLVVSLSSLLIVDALARWGLDTSTAIALGRERPAQLTLFAVMVLLWSFAGAASVLVGLEILVPTGSLPAPQHLFVGWGRRWRQTRRNTRIMSIAAKHGLAAPLRGFGRASNHEQVARSLRMALNEAGVTFVKLGQMLSTRSDLLPEPYIRELSSLQNRATPIPFGEVSRALTESLGRPVDEIFAGIDPAPLASASLGQVHRARLHDGRQVVVKVQRPGAGQQVATDLDTLQGLARQLDQGTGWGARLGLEGLIAGFAASLREELDYRVEAANTRAIAATVVNHPRVRVPAIIDELSSDRVLVMEHLDGTPLSQLGAVVNDLSPQTRAVMANDLLSAVLHQIMSEGVFHADLHAGNLMVWPDSTVGLLDFGSVGRLDATSRRQLVHLLWAIDRDDPTAALDALLILLDPPERLDERQLRRDLGTFIAQVRSGGESINLFGALMSIVVQHGFGVPPMLAAALRALGAVEGTLRVLDPGVDLVGDARAMGQQLLGNLTPQSLKEEATSRLAQMMPLLDRLPRSVARITEDLEQGRFSTHARVISHPDDRYFVTALANQLAGALLAAAAVLGGVLLVTHDGGPTFLPEVSLTAFFGYLLTFAGFTLALRVVAQMYHPRA